MHLGRYLRSCYKSDNPIFYLQDRNKMFLRTGYRVLQSTRRHITEDNILHRNFHENPKYPQDKIKYKIDSPNNRV